MSETPPFVVPYTTEGDALVAYLTEHTGQPWKRSGDGAVMTLPGVRVTVYSYGTYAHIGPVQVTLWSDRPHVAVPVLSDPTALRTRVREALSDALATIDTEPTP